MERSTEVFKLLQDFSRSSPPKPKYVYTIIQCKIWFPFRFTCRRRSCCGSTRAGHPTGSSPCLRCGWRTRTGRAPAPPPWPPLPPPEGGAAGRGLGRLLRMSGLIRLRLCSSPTPPRTLWEDATFILSITSDRAANV